VSQLLLLDPSQIPQIPLEQNPHDRRYPVERVEAALGEECVRELQQAKPQRPADTGCIRDRFVVNAGAVGYWLFIHFGFNIFAVESADEIDVDPMAETITVHGERYSLPHWCYLNTGLEPGDRRPTYWPGLPKSQRPEPLLLSSLQHDR
jgi:hypothetical protein